MSRTPLLDQIRATEIEEKRGHPLILKELVTSWLAANPDSSDKFTEEDFEILKDLIVRGTTRDGNVFSPSGATRCTRLQIIDKHPEFKADPLTDAKLISIFMDGNWRHLKWQMVFHKMGIAESFEIFKKIGPLDYGGSYDVVVWLNLSKITENKEDEKAKVIVDIKGINDRGFHEIYKSRKAKRAHWVQVQIYMMLHNIQFAIVWYENKNTQEIVEILVEADYEFWKKVRRRSKRMRHFLELGGFPAEECDVAGKSSEFYSCPQRKACQRLPVHVIENNQLRKISEPRIKSKKSKYEQWNRLPLRRLKDPLKVLKKHSKKLAV